MSSEEDLKILKSVTQKIKNNKIKQGQGKTKLRNALQSLTMKLNAKPISFSQPKQPKHPYSPISNDVNQGFTNFCVGCTISRHFVTILTEILKLANYKLK